MKVRATREGLVGHATASGYLIDVHVPFVALPCERALYRVVRVRNSLTEKECLALILDVGPWNTHDEDYVFHGARPQAETGMDTRGRVTNGAGIDLGEKVWTLLGMRGNSDVEWEFIE